jgi:predicted DNA-binding helix-hairpin-helix protein
MIIGADPSTDAQILSTSANLYSSYGLRRVYYSAFSPIADPSARLPAVQPPLLREHRLYQSDWLMRFYGYRHEELTAGTEGETAGRGELGKGKGMLSLDVDPKLGWAVRNRSFFPVDVNRASREQLLRAPGLGAKTVTRLLQMRRWQKVRLEDLVALKVNIRKAMPFIICANHRPAAAEAGTARLLAHVSPPGQLALAL